MYQVSSIFVNPKIPTFNFKSRNTEKTAGKQKTAENYELISRYMQNTAVLNAASIKRTSGPSFRSSETYTNNLRTMIHNNESVMIAIAPRTFTANDINGDGIVSISSGEKPGTFLSAIDRLDELKDDGFNTIHLHE